MAAEAIIDVPEEALVRFMFDRRPEFDNIVIPPQCPGRVIARLCVRPTDLNLPVESFGDIDVLLVPEELPHQCRAVQYKRIKIKPDSFRSGVPNKLAQLSKASRQANALVLVGFAYVWLNILVVTDSREHNRGENSFTGATPSLLRQVTTRAQNMKLDSAVGLEIIELAQPMDKPVTECHSAGGNMIRPALRQSQPPALTAAIKQLLSAS